MTPEELRSFMEECDLEPSAIAFPLGIERQQVRDYLSGDVTAISADVRVSIRAKFEVPEHKRVLARDEQDATYDGIGDFVLRHSVHYQFEKQGSRQTASGTLIQIKDRVFVATAGHTIPRGTQFLEFVGENIACVEETKDKSTGRSTWKGSSQILIRNGGRHDTLDVGFFELDTIAPEVLSRYALPLSSVSVRAPQYGRIAFVLGYPFEFERLVHISPSSGVLHVGSLNYSKELLAPEEWPQTPQDSLSPKESVDCFLKYSRDDPFQAVVPAGSKAAPLNLSLPEKLPAVGGMSGGGFWQRWTPAGEKGMWYPCDYELFAIQHSWYEKGRYVRGVQIRHWLDLVADNNEELRSLITDHVSSQGNEQLIRQ